MTFETTAENDSRLMQAVALRAISGNQIHSTVTKLRLAQQAADLFSTELNEIGYVLLVALGKVQPGEDGEGDPLSLAKEAAHILQGLRL